MALPKLFERIFWHNNTTPAINEDNLNAMSKAIDDIDDRVILIGDDVVTVIPQIQAYLEQAESIVEAVEELSQNPPYIGANGNWYVFDTTLEAYKDSGVDASITVDIADITMIAEGAQPYVTNSGTNTDPVFHLFLPQSPQGATGNGIANIAKTSTQGLVDTYTITMTDGTTYTFTVTNGQNGSGTGDMLQADYDSDSTVKNSGGIADYVEGELSALPYTNPNLLDNPWFTVNQRGQSSYTGNSSANVYTVDRWYINRYASDVTMTVNNDGTITLANTGSNNNQQVGQFLEDTLLVTGKTYTLSLDVVSYSGTVRALFAGHNSPYPTIVDKLIGNTGVISKSGTYDGTSNTYKVAISLGANSSITLRAIKLELGSVSTLAQDTAPNYATELLKCQRYFYRLATTNAFMGYMHSSSVARIILPTPVTMRTRPTWTPSDVTGLQIVSGTTTQTLSNSQTLSWAGFTPQEFVIAISDLTSPFTSGEFCMMKLNTSYIDLSADL